MLGDLDSDNIATSYPKMYLVSAHFELGRIPRRVLVSRALGMTLWCFIRRHVTVDVEWQPDCGP